VTEEMVEMRWRNKEEFMESSGRTNVVIAAYTTAQARLQLYSYLEKSEFLLNPVFPFCTHNFLDPLPQNELCYSTVLHL
jgi:hypothetical protein